MSKKKVFHLVVLLILCQSTYAQKGSWKVNFGTGFPEFLNMGIGYMYSENNQIEASYGILPSVKNSLFVTTLDHSIFIRNSKKFEELKTWYFGQKLNYYNERSSRVKFEHMFIGLDIGRQFHFSNSFGLSLDIGLVYTLFNEENYIDSTQGELDESIETPLLPSMNLQFFYRF